MKPATTTESKKRKAEDAVSTANKKSKAAPAAAGGDDEEGSDLKTVFVGGLSWNVDSDWLKTEFEECGEIVSARVITERDSGRSKG